MAANVVGVSGTDHNRLSDGLITIEPDLNFVFSWNEIKSLKGAVEVVDDAGMGLVHINFNIVTGCLRVYFDPNGSLIGVPVRPVTIATVTTITVAVAMPVTMPVVAMPIAMPVVAMPVVVLGIGLGRK